MTHLLCMMTAVLVQEPAALPPFKPMPIETVMSLVAEDLAVQPDVLRFQSRYFDLSDMPANMLEPAINSLLFWTNSVSSAGEIFPLTPVSRSDNRIFRVHIDQAAWTAEAWEKVAQLEPYYVDPITPSSAERKAYKDWSYIRQTIGNGIIRGSWFIVHASDTSLFLKEGQVKADNAPYYTLLYAKSKFKRKGVDVVGQPPDNVDEFRQAWEVNLDVLNRHNVDRGGVVDENDSIVAFRNRVLWRVRTPIGVYWQTFDVFNSVGGKDFIENPFPKEWDANEYIVQHAKGLQFYLLTNGKGERIEFADPRIAKDTTDPHIQIVRNARSCVTCHSEGIRPIRNELEPLLNNGVELKAKAGFAEKARVFYLNDLKKHIKRDQEDYSDGVLNCNGLTSEANTQQFQLMLKWYDAPITLEQAAFETGLPTEKFLEAISVTAKGRLGRLVTDKKPIPRNVWETGLFHEAAILCQQVKN